MNWLLLALALCNLIAVVSAFFPRPVLHGPVFVSTVFAFSLLTTEFPWLLLLLQMSLAVLLVLGGALESPVGQVALGILILTWPGLAALHWQSVHRAGDAVENALRAGLGVDYRDRMAPQAQRNLRTRVRFADWRNPIRFSRPDVERVADLPYLPGGIRQRLDLYRPQQPPSRGCPVLLQIHGGAWMIGHKAQQALPLMYHMASKGWICVSANYRLSPSVGFPTHLEDCKSALCWIREHGREYGMNPGFVAVTGGSAGGQLAALMALTANRPDLQKLHPRTDTSVQACVPFYGAYDLLHGYDFHPDRGVFERLLADNVMHSTSRDKPDLWQLASPVNQVHEHAPPFMIVHGSRDSLVPVDIARGFYSGLRSVSRSPVVYLEVPGAEHGFEMMHSARTEYVIDGVHRFLECVRTQFLPTP